MKKLWKNNSYTILLVIVSCLSALFLYNVQIEENESYVKVTVTTGDTIWELAEKYADVSNLSKKQFVNWVKTHNENVSVQKLNPGEQLVLPVKKLEIGAGTQLASAVGE